MMLAKATTNHRPSAAPYADGKQDFPITSDRYPYCFLRLKSRKVFAREDEGRGMFQQLSKALAKRGFDEGLRSEKIGESEQQ